MVSEWEVSEVDGWEWGTEGQGAGTMVINKGMALLLTTYDAVYLYSTSNTLYCIILYCYICNTVAVSVKSLTKIFVDKQPM